METLRLSLRLKTSVKHIEKKFRKKKSIANYLKILIVKQAFKSKYKTKFNYCNYLNACKANSLFNQSREHH